MEVLHMADQQTKGCVDGSAPTSADRLLANSIDDQFNPRLARAQTGSGMPSWFTV